MSLIAMIFPAVVLAAGAAPADNEYFTIQVVDADTGRGVPMVELRTVNSIRYYTDSNGLVAFHEPGLMNRKVFFHVKSHGYESPKDGFGIAGRGFDVAPGGRAKIELKRLNIAERLYRITGAGIYRDSVLLNEPVPTAQPVINGLVMGQDSVFTIVYGGRLYWFWGDTGKPDYPLGNFHMSGATSQLPTDGGLDPEVGIDLTYFVDKNGFSKEMAKMAGDGPTWADAFVVLPDEHGKDRLYGGYAKIRPADMSTHTRGLMIYDDAKEEFEQIATLPIDAPIHPAAHAFKHKVDGREYIYFSTPFPLSRVRATVEDYCRLASYEAFTCLKPGSRRDDLKVDRDEAGHVRYGWKRDTPVVSPMQQADLVKSGALQPDEVLTHLQDADTGKSILAHAGSVYWNPYRQRWVLIVCEIFGTSVLGETWFAEADTPLGPWVYARKVVTHEQYSFYNPKQHPMLAKQDGRIVFFEGTYTHSFSGNPVQTPRYDYNQIMYKLDLADARLNLPVPVYRVTDKGGNVRYGIAGQVRVGDGQAEAAFFALERPGEGAVPVYAETTTGGGQKLKFGEQPNEFAVVAPKPVFYALPAQAESAPEATVPLFEYVNGSGSERSYATDDCQAPAGLTRSKEPLCRVWRNPMGPRVSSLFPGIRDIPQ